MGILSKLTRKPEKTRCERMKEECSALVNRINGKIDDRYKPYIITGALAGTVAVVGLIIGMKLRNAK